MDNTNYTTEHKKYQHITSEERHEIEVRLKDGWSIYRISKHLRRPYNTIKNEIKRGTVWLYNGKVSRYKADKGKEVYLQHRQNSRRNYRCLETVKFLQYVEQQFFDEGWSLDTCVGKAKETHRFKPEEMVCTKTLYNYVDLGLLKVKNIDLPEKLIRNTKTKRTRENKRKLGRSIEERPKEIETREEFGHWEIDSVIGRKKEGEPQVMTIVERKLRMSIWIKVRDHSAEAIDEAMLELITCSVEGKQVITVTNVEPLTTADSADTADTSAPAVPAQAPAVKPPKRTVKAKKDTTTFTTILQVGDKEFDITNIAENALKAYKSVHKRKNVTDFVVYVKPEENAAYYTVNGEGSEEYKVEL